MGKVTVGAHPLSLLREILKVVPSVARRQLDVLQRESLKIFFWNKPGLMGAIDSTGEEEGRVVLLPQLTSYPVGDEIVSPKLLISGFEGPPVRFDILPRTTPWQTQWPLVRIEGAGKGALCLGRRKVVIPRTGINDIVQHLS